MVAPDIFEGCFPCSAKVLAQSQLGQRSQFPIIQHLVDHYSFNVVVNMMLNTKEIRFFQKIGFLTMFNILLTTTSFPFISLIPNF
jgi:hypothetical protein